MSFAVYKKCQEMGATPKVASRIANVQENNECPAELRTFLRGFVKEDVNPNFFCPEAIRRVC